MTDSVPPDRTIPGLPPRRLQPEPTLSRLLASERGGAAEAAVPAQSLDPVEARTTVGTEDHKAEPRKKPTRRTAPTNRTAAASRPQEPAPQSVDSSSVKHTTYISETVRDRGRAAFRATSAAEGDSSWSQFVETAIARETARREEIYNKGKPYLPDTGRLPAGRPLG